MAHSSELRESHIMPAPCQVETAVISSLRIPKIKNTSQMSNSSSSLVLTKQELQELIEKRETIHKQILRLHSVLERTSKAVGDITRKHDGREWRDQTFKDNMRLQQDTEKRVHELREEMSEIDKKIALAKEPDIPEENNEAANSSPTSTSMLEEENQYDASEVFSTSAPRYEFFDPGSHWCSQCNEIHSDLDSYLKHLHSKSHSGKIDPNEQAWISKKFCKPKPKISPDQPLETIQIKGTQFILPIRGYFCKICETFMANVAHAEDHLKTKDHDRLYNRYVLVNQNYEQKYGVDKARAMNKILNEKKRKREQEEREERERENKKRQQEADQRRRERILREKAEEENRLKAKAQREARESAERDREREREKEKKKLLRAKERLVERDRKEKKSKAIIDSSDESDDSSVDSSKFKAREKVKTESSSSTVPDKNDKKLTMRLIVDIPKNEWQLCYNKHMKRMLRRKNSINKPEKLAKEEIPSTVINKGNTKSPGITSLPSFSMDVESTQEPDPIGQDVDSSIDNIVSSISFKQTDSEEEKSMGNKQFSAFTIEADDDEEEIEINSGQFYNESNLVRVGTTTQRKIPNKIEISSNDEVVMPFSSGIELDEDLSPLSTTDSSLAFGSKDPNLNSSDPISSTHNPRSSKFITNGDRKIPENSSIDTFDLPSAPRNTNFNESEERAGSVVDRLLAIQNECVRIEKSSSKRNRTMDEGTDKAESYPTFDLNDLTKSPSYSSYTDEIFFPTD